MWFSRFITSCMVCLYCTAASASHLNDIRQDIRFISHIVDPYQGQLAMVWRDAEQQPYQHFQHVAATLKKEGKTLRFAMNAGIFQEDLTPLGLYIERGKVLHRLSVREKGYGNFYLQPNGVFLIRHNGQAEIVATQEFVLDKSIEYATQSGPLLVHQGQINTVFNPLSTSLKIRNGVGILPDGRVIFVMSRYFVRFYDFAAFFKALGCQSALYLDGSVSRLFLPEQNIEQDGVFGPMIIEWRDQ